MAVTEISFSITDGSLNVSEILLTTESTSRSVG
jgi:hypothetical protein